MPITLPAGFGSPSGDNYLTHIAEAGNFAFRKRRRKVGKLAAATKKSRAAARRAKLTAFQSMCASFLKGYAGYSTQQINRLSGSQIAEAARLICIRDGQDDWIGFISDWYEGQQK